MALLQNIAIYCGSSSGLDPSYHKEAYHLGEILAQHKMGIVYGGASVGLMGAVANGCLENHGKVIGVIPTFLKRKEIEHMGLSELIQVESMHERKRIMFERSDAFLVLPGGFGTMEEFFEVVTWSQLGLHNKPIVLLNWNGFYDSLVQMFHTMVGSGFLKKENMDLVIVLRETKDLLTQLQNYSPSKTEKWLSEDTI
ncbi:TIGR00730 family Rossman fold protein [Leptospira levettii]|uniref:Cytokinin riboside 5'-monophosphate phosphoribohydrolase n=1 Tax=Leptospira levettii TaxID=2023178 RepID=A0A5F2D7T3_9LEPT|nr:TIGR00730 family Rossman fold protein [Leptospira levettii]MCG6146869.1 TIGR00730 family Rossman fold protein [Leptospira levettii]MCW7465837.1 TIGR00730 family Rossman fold protein [Leptospira levettii]MCW7496675.1 TIGR00730 family Rossman fold protein [Leptospira levettii]MCW7506947.1 TIGR00730 family Rossman fold protein [Leptospira levettii]MCW7510575.1 TIGR00730 family Rossman fold protein [Leptospira levettii]